MSLPIMSFRDVSLSFADHELFKKINFHCFNRNVICLIGKNGCGKSSLMKMIIGDYEADHGEIYYKPGIKIGYLPQEVIFSETETIYEYVLKEIDGNLDEKRYLADIVIENLGLDGQKLMKTQSGGKVRRAALAKSLVNEPDLLLLDEPTNHLDVSAIEWLEAYLKTFRGCVIVISHDRAFLENVSNRMIMLDRGESFVNDQSFKFFDQWQDEILEKEAKELDKMGKKLDEEEVWRNQGVTARRKRNQQRMSNLLQLRQDFQGQKSKFNNIFSKMKLPPFKEGSRAKIAFEMDQISHEFTDVSPPKQIIDSFSIRAIKGEKLGIIGKNGAGKSTLIKILIGKIKPTSGAVTLGKNVEVSYFEQDKSSLELDKTLWRNLASEGDYVMVGNQPKHVIAYLKDFMFDRKQADAKVSTLSGGQRSRLLLAKILAQPKSLLVLDEPTNDLDMDSLDILRDVLADYKGTLIIISHDRDFINKIVTRTLVFSKNDKDKLIVEDVIGGYSDYSKMFAAEKSKNKQKEAIKKQEKSPKILTKLTYKLQRELDMLPGEIDELEQNIVRNEEILADASLYEKNPDKFTKISTELENAKESLEFKEMRWLEISEMQENLK